MENLKTCELCLKQIIKTENLNYDEKENLKILKNLEITVSKDAKICSNCVNVSHLTHNFKMSCLTNNDHLKTLIHPGINDKLILEEVVVEETKSEFKNEKKVCRFCLNFSEVNSLVEVNLEQDVVLKDMLGRCLPEIDTNVVQNPLICSICRELLEKLFNFISQCENTEILRNLDTKTDAHFIENTPTVTVANNEDNIYNSFMKEENCEDIENPELQIKSEDSNIDEDIKDSVNDSNCLLNESEIQKEPSSFLSDSFRCKLCFHKADSRMSLLTHQRTHWKTKKSVRNKLYKCTECPFQSKYQSSLVRHKKDRKTPCGNCEEEKVELNKCEIVTHKKKGHKDRKRGLGNSVEENDVKPKPHSTIKEKKFICDICSYQTTKNSVLKQHYIIHKVPSEANLFKCDYCSFTTKWKNSLTLHKMRHENPSELLKCNDCSYETNAKSQLVRHVLVHKDPSQVDMYKCKVCPFQTKYKGCILVHKKQHQVEIYACDECNYKSKFKSSFMLHLRYHKEWKQPAKSNQNLKKVKHFKCNQCSYVGTRNSHLIQHQMLHKDPLNREMYSCTECSFQALYKITLKRHYKKHHSNLEIPFGELKTFRCNECDYETLYRKSLLKHLQAHEQEGSR